MSVQSSHASIQRGQNATFVIAVSTQNGSAADVSVTVAADPTTQKPTFTSGCTTGDKTATCGVGSVSDTKAVDLDVQIPVSASATISSVKLTATASIVTTATWTAPSAASTVAVTSVSASPSATKSAPSTPAQSALPVGPLPTLNGESSSLIGAGNAAGLFPAISPSATPSPSSTGTGTGAQAQETRKNADSMADSSSIAPVLTAQIAGLIALAVALLLTLTRLSLRKYLRFGR